MSDWVRTGSDFGVVIVAVVEGGCGCGWRCLFSCVGLECHLKRLLTVIYPYWLDGKTGQPGDVLPDKGNAISFSAAMLLRVRCKSASACVGSGQNDGHG